MWSIQAHTLFRISQMLHIFATIQRIYTVVQHCAKTARMISVKISPTPAAGTVQFSV